MADSDDAALTQEQTEELRRQREALKSAPPVTGSATWEDELVKRQLAKNAARQWKQYPDSKLPPELEEALKKSVESLEREEMAKKKPMIPPATFTPVPPLGYYGLGTAVFGSGSVPGPWSAQPEPAPPALSHRELALIEKMCQLMVHLLPDGFQIERVANGVDDKSVCVIVRATHKAVEQPRLPHTVDPRDQLISDLIKAGNKMKKEVNGSLDPMKIEWEACVRLAAESLFDGIVPGEGP
jgi:hypothetical protein